MNILRIIIAEIVGMFFDDELLALAVLAVVGLAALLAYGLHAGSLVVGVLLLVGCVGVLVASTVKALRRE